MDITNKDIYAHILQRIFKPAELNDDDFYVCECSEGVAMIRRNKSSANYRRFANWLGHRYDLQKQPDPPKTIFNTIWDAVYVTTDSNRARKIPFEIKGLHMICERSVMTIYDTKYYIIWA